MKFWFQPLFCLFLLGITFLCSAQTTGKAFKKEPKFLAKIIKTRQFYNPKSKKSIAIIGRLQGGYGLSYGVMGINGEVGLSNLTFSVGVGYGKFKGTSPVLGYAIGLKGYIFKPEKQFRPRIGVYYGLTNVYLETSTDAVSLAKTTTQTAAYGPSVGIGFEHKINEFIVYSIEYTFIGNSFNSYRPENKALENLASPSIGIGVYF